MKKENILQDGYSIAVYEFNTVVVGTGTAGYKAADSLYAYGQKSVAIVTEGINRGTSRNTGSDKQTYYKLTLSGNEPDSVIEMAETLFKGQCVDGDIALCEAALSVQCFMGLTALGIPFPQNRYGEYIGYKTDHDPKRRATSAGPYTSKLMTEALQKSVELKGIEVFDRMQVIKILVGGNRVQGLLCLNTGGKEEKFSLFCCKNIVYATGGPAGIYKDSVYPLGHYGGTGIALEAGVMGRNLTEWQYGLASLKPRWNVSGTYMQALPRFISTDAEGGDEREFLSDFFGDYGRLINMIFLKGYQWPFDVNKIKEGSSIIDILVYRERVNNRRVFLDFRSNPENRAVDFSYLSDEAREYLEKAGGNQETPIERLIHMNSPAVDFYLDKGVDLSKQPLEISLSAQHNNGGLSVDCWWQTNIEGFFAAGEAAASHGVYRPGGSALNAGQVGAVRAAKYICANRTGDAGFTKEMLEEMLEKIKPVLDLAKVCAGRDKNIRKLWDEAMIRMSRWGGAIREPENLQKALYETKQSLDNFTEDVKGAADISTVFRYYDCLITQNVYLEAMLNYIEKGGQSRGSGLYGGLTEALNGNVSIGDKDMGEMVQEAVYRARVRESAQVLEATVDFTWREVNPIPDTDDVFENVWREFREKEQTS